MHDSNKHWLLALGVALALGVPAAQAAEAGRHSGKGLSEIPDPELGQMRGRYTVGGNAVAWFGVTMISTWQTTTGQSLQGALRLGMDFSKGGNKPVVTFQPTVSVTAGDVQAAPTADGSRHVDGSGLANAGGLVQSVQVAGDGNVAGNVTYLTVRDGDAPASDGAATAMPMAVSIGSGDALASASFDGNAARVLLQIQGQGAVEQWIRSGSLGQSVQLTSDGQRVANRLDIDLVRQSVASNAQLLQNVAQSIALARGLSGAGGGY